MERHTLPTRVLVIRGLNLTTISWISTFQNFPTCRKEDFASRGHEKSSWARLLELHPRSAKKPSVLFMCTISKQSYYSAYTTAKATSDEVLDLVCRGLRRSHCRRFCSSSRSQSVASARVPWDALYRCRPIRSFLPI